MLGRSAVYIKNVVELESAAFKKSVVKLVCVNVDLKWHKRSIVGANVGLALLKGQNRADSPLLAHYKEGRLCGVEYHL